MLAHHSDDRTSAVTVVAPARLHMGFIDLGGSLGRRFGSIGVGVDEIATRITLRPADTLEAEGPSAERALKAARRFCENFGVPCRASIHVHQAIPEHVGLGSGTQMALAVSMGLAKLHGLALELRDAARAIERGARSGIGIAVFEQGGLILDGGRGPDTITPPVISRMEMPADWRFILIFDERGQGLHGKQEIDAFAALPPFPEALAAHLCHRILMQALPALAEGNLVDFGAVITELQQAVGDHFAPAQGGRFTSPEVGAALAWLEAQGAVGLGQSSWGPTGFCLLDDPQRARKLCDEAGGRFGGLTFVVATPRNRGAEIVSEERESCRLRTRTARQAGN
ncbi:MAG: kinase [Proteobacteria bacterium]|nr:kinase [Pseudomonadota bacterium]